MAGYGFGQYCFEELLKALSYTTNEVIVNEIVKVFDAYIMEHVTTYTIPLPTSKIWQMQENNEKLHQLHPCIEKEHLKDSGYFLDPSNGLVRRCIEDKHQTFKPLVLPGSFISTALLLCYSPMTTQVIMLSGTHMMYSRGSITGRYKKGCSDALQTLPNLC